MDCFRGFSRVCYGVPGATDTGFDHPQGIRENFRPRFSEGLWLGNVGKAWVNSIVNQPKSIVYLRGINNDKNL